MKLTKEFEPCSKIQYETRTAELEHIRDLCDLAKDCIFSDHDCSTCPATMRTSIDCAKRIVAEGYNEERIQEEFDLWMVLGGPDETER